MTLISLLFAISATTGSGLDSARLLLADGSGCRMAISSKALSSEPANLAQSDKEQKKALADLETHGPDAIAAAASTPELSAAVKAYYSAASAYCKNPSNAGEKQLDATEKVLDKMLDDAGR